MKNLAGDKDSDRAIHHELTRCGIEIVANPERITGEVPATLTGKLGEFTFRRAWYYWVVEGPMPLDVALRLYADVVGRADIRVGGYAGNISPLEYGTDYFDADGLQLFSDPEGRESATMSGLIERGILPADAMSGSRFVPDKRVGYARAEVRCYHVDSELGLYLLANAIRALAPSCSPPTAIQLGLSPSQARELATELLECADDSEAQ